MTGSTTFIIGHQQMSTENVKNSRNRGSDSQRMTSQLVVILRNKNGQVNADRLQLESMANRACHCREPYVDPLTKKEKNRPWCKVAGLCPNCQTRIAKANYRVLFSQFEEYIGSGRLHEVRITSDCGNVSGRRLRKIIQRMIRTFKELTSRSAWNAVVVRVGAIIHATWKDASDTHGAGYHVHLHAICLTRTPLPRFDTIKDECLKILGVTGRASVVDDDHFSHRPVRNLSKAVRYFTHWRKRVCGAPAVGGQGWSLWNIPDADIIAYVDGTKNLLRILQRGFDPDVLRVARRRIGRASDRAEPRQAEMASVYTQLSFRSPRKLTSRFSNLAEYIGERCRKGRRCHLRAACPWCLRRRLDRELKAITAVHGKGGHLVSVVLRAPGLVPEDELESSSEAFHAAIKKLLRPRESGLPASVWKIQVRPQPVDGHTAFSLSASMLVSAASTIDGTQLKSRWQQQLKSVGLKCRPEGKKATVVIHPVEDLAAEARKLVARVRSILGPIAAMSPKAASAYLHVLAMRSGLGVPADDEAQSTQVRPLAKE